MNIVTETTGTGSMVGIASGSELELSSFRCHKSFIIKTKTKLCWPFVASAWRWHCTISHGELAMYCSLLNIYCRIKDL